jgi:hypothetical protein
MNESLQHRATDDGHEGCSGAAPLDAVDMKRGARGASLCVDHSVLAGLIARRWRQDRLPCPLNVNARACKTWLKASWRPQPGRNALELHWSRGAPALRMQAWFRQG